METSWPLWFMDITCTLPVLNKSKYGRGQIYYMYMCVCCLYVCLTIFLLLLWMLIAACEGWSGVMPCRTCHMFTAQEVLHQLQDIVTDESDGEDSELDLDRENSDEFNSCWFCNRFCFSALHLVIAAQKMPLVTFPQNIYFSMKYFVIHCPVWFVGNNYPLICQQQLPIGCLKRHR